MSFTNLFNKMLLLLIFIVVGFIAGKTKILDETGSKKLNKVMLYICQPALVIGSVVNTGPDVSTGDILWLIVYALAMNLILLALGFLLVPLMRVRKDERGTYRFMIAFGNVIFMGLPVTTALYGDQVIFLVSICGMPFNLLVYSIGVYLISGKGIDRSFFKNTLLNPALIATFAALILFFAGIELPSFIGEAAGSLGDMVIPGAMLLIGATLASVSPRDMLADPHIYLLCLAKLILAPIVVKLLCGLFIQNEMYLNILVVSAAMPTAAITTMFAYEYGSHVSTASRGVFVTTLFSLVTIPAMVYLLIL
ncbi:MAG: AEC family transporter [Oscillospiraceae bacterium]